MGTGGADRTDGTVRAGVSVEMAGPAVAAGRTAGTGTSRCAATAALASPSAGATAAARTAARAALWLRATVAGECRVFAPVLPRVADTANAESDAKPGTRDGLAELVDDAVDIVGVDDGLFAVLEVLQAAVRPNRR